MEEKSKQTRNQPAELIKVVLYGPESTGKTTLAKQLATHYNTFWVPEYMREFLQKKWDSEKKLVEKEDLIPIAKGQLRLENELSEKVNDLLICDTNLLELKVYSEYYYDGFCPPEIKNEATKNNYSIYLLTYVDTPWEADDLRDRPENREEMFRIFEAELKKQGFPPVKIKGKMLHEKSVKIKADVSRQYISALMLVAPKFPEGLKISLTGETASAPYIKMTLSLLKNIGIAGSFKNSKIEIPATKDIIKTTLTVESDWSSASYFYSLVALSENGKITLEKFYAESLQGDSILPQIYDSLGVKTVFNSSEKTISLSKIECQLPDSLLLALANTPDLAQTLAVTCFGLGLGCKLTGLKTLKIKETDRLLALKNELEKLGATVQIDDDSLRLEPAAHIFPNQTVETYQDHRMAMAFAPLALKTQITINDADVVSKSYPGFWNDLMKTGIECAFKDS